MSVAMAAAGERVAAGVGRVVRQRKRAYVQVSDIEILPGLDDAYVLRVHRAQLFRHGVPRALGGVDGKVEFAGQYARAGHVVAVLVRNEDALHGKRVYTAALHDSRHLLATASDIHQNARRF